MREHVYNMIENIAPFSPSPFPSSLCSFPFLSLLLPLPFPSPPLYAPFPSSPYFSLSLSLPLLSMLLSLPLLSSPSPSPSPFPSSLCSFPFLSFLLPLPLPLPSPPLYAPFPSSPFFSLSLSLFSLPLSPCISIFLPPGNQITVISGVQSLARLTHLSLAENRIESIANLNGLPLQNLNLVSCAITILYGLVCGRD